MKTEDWLSKCHNNTRHNGLLTQQTKMNKNNFSFVWVSQHMSSLARLHMIAYQTSTWWTSTMEKLQKYSDHNILLSITNYELETIPLPLRRQFFHNFYDSAYSIPYLR